jgi:hypothetical protein
VVLDREPDGAQQDGWRYECRGDGPAYRSLWLPDGDDLVAYEASRGSGLLMVEATLRHVVHRAVTGADASRLPALVKYRLTAAQQDQPPAPPPAEGFRAPGGKSRGHNSGGIERCGPGGCRPAVAQTGRLQTFTSMRRGWAPGAFGMWTSSTPSR